MELEPDACYEALVTHDARFDGAFFVGVATTGIYCRTVCPARTPRRDRCTFHPSAAAAERAGFRPCLRCRPELAPGNAHVDATDRLAAAIASRIEDGALTECGTAGLAHALGISDRHLRRVVEGAFGVSPIVLAQTQRLLLAKRLLTDTTLPITEIALASGFSSLRRFNALFKERYRLNPSQARRNGRGIVATNQADLVCELAYRPPFDWDALLLYIQHHASIGSEKVEGNRYLRTVAWKAHRGWLSVEPVPGKHTVRVTLAASLAPVLLPVLARVKRLFDLSADPLRIASHLGALAQARPGLRVPGAFDGFETAVRAILGQQISVRAATTLMGRLTSAFGELIVTPFEGLDRLAPTAERLAKADVEEFTAHGIIAARARAIIALARAVTDDAIRLEPGGDVEETMRLLKELPGIGEWTAQYIAMRALGWPDAFLATDLGVRQALGTTDTKHILALAEAWRPWRAYALMHLWKSLEKVTPQ